MVLYVRYLGIAGRHAEVSVAREGDVYSAELSLFPGGDAPAQVFRATAASPDEAEEAVRLLAMAHVHPGSVNPDPPDPDEDRS